MNERWYLSMDIGGTKIRAGLVSSDGSVLHVHRTDTDVGSVDGFIKRTVIAAQHQLNQAAEEGLEIQGIGIGVPGYVDVKRGVVMDASTIGVRDVPLAHHLTSQFGLPVRIDNDVRVAALGHLLFGTKRLQTSGAQADIGSTDNASAEKTSMDTKPADRTSMDTKSTDRATVDSFLYVSVGTGVACCPVIAGELYRGVSDRAGEMGHVIVQRGGPPCTCGNSGCLEAICSGPGIARAYANYVGDVKDVTSEDVMARARDNDPVALKVVNKSATALGHVMGNLINVLDIHRVILGGGLSEAGEVFTNPVRQALGETLIDDLRSYVELEVSDLAQMAPLFGAMLLFETRSLSRDGKREMGMGA